MTLFVSMGMYAQHVAESKALDNVYVTVSAGIMNNTTDIQIGEPCFYKGIRPQFGIEVGKSLTTLYTTGLEFSTAVNTTGAKTAFDEFSLLWLHKVNVSNLIWNYNPNRAWELEAVGGLGWGHDAVISDNYGVVQAGLELAYNMSEAWAFKINPFIEWNHVNDGLNVNNSDVGLAVGFTYKFRNGDGNRGFLVCDRDELNSRINELRADNELLTQELNGQKELNKQINQQLNKLKEHSCKVDTVIIDNTIAPTIGFVINKAELTEQSNAYLYQIAQAFKDSELVVKGYADVQTGSPEYNMELSKQRAEVVKAKLIEYGATNVTTEAYGDTVQPFANNDMNRVAIVVKK